MQNEKIEVVHEHSGELVGLSLPRHEVIENKHWCRSTNIFVLNRHGNILCHQRSAHKERYPNAWSTHLGGHLSHGETYEHNALKELEEEVGIKIDPAMLIPWRTTRINKSRLWVREFMTVFDGDINDLKLQTEEVQSVKWFTPLEILREYQHNPDLWLAGTHDFKTEYLCLRAVLTACLSAGVFAKDFHHLHAWHPLPL
ncbi:MAG TPA: NUDIX domain-containing protein [Flavobacterium sp.]|nr:NUDIX domain-containing protein [Flavobacterium sp.]